MINFTLILNKEKIIKFLNPLIIYLICFSSTLIIFLEARKYGLLGMPVDGMDQKTMLDTAVNLYYGKLPEGNYYYSYSYTIFLYLLILVSNGNLFLMKIFQAAVCSFTPVVIYKLSLKIKIRPLFSFIASLFFCFYAPGILISLSFLRAGTLALCFICFLYFTILAFQTGGKKYFFIAGLFAALCILGRENFIPLVLMPLFFLFIKEIRAKVKLLNLSIFLFTAIGLVLIFVIFNFVNYGSFAIIPGHVSNVLGAYHGDAFHAGGNFKLLSVIMQNIPLQLYKSVCSYEIPNSLSVYAHNDIIKSLNWLFISFNLFISLSVISLIQIRNNKYIFLIILSAAAYIGTMIFFEMFYRFRIPVVPLLCVLSGIAIQAIFDLWRKKRVNSLILILIGIFIFYITYISPEKLRPESEKLSAVKMLILQKRFTEAKAKLSRMNKKTGNVQFMWQKFYEYSKK